MGGQISWPALGVYSQILCSRETSRLLETLVMKSLEFPFGHVLTDEAPPLLNNEIKLG